MSAIAQISTNEWDVHIVIVNTLYLLFWYTN